MKTLPLSDIKRIIEIMGSIVIENEVFFCELDAAIGDGDFGATLAKGFMAIQDEAGSINAAQDAGELFTLCGGIILDNCGGATGPLWGGAFLAAGRVSREKTSLGTKDIAEALGVASEKIKKLTNGDVGDKTMLDALVPALDAASRCAEKDTNILETMHSIAKAAVEGAKKTVNMKAAKGRASYLGERSIGSPDAGAHAIGVIFMQIFERFLG